MQKKIQDFLKKNEDKEYLFLDFLQKKLKNTLFDCFFEFISLLTAAGFIWFVLVIFLLISNNKQNTILAFALLTALSLHIVLSHYFIKNYIARKRPRKNRGYENKIVEKQKVNTRNKEKISYSFPSGHVCSSFAATSLLGMYHSIFFYYALPFILLVSFSRIYLYKHFPSDVFAGMLLGIFFAIISYFLTESVGIKILQYIT